MRKRRIIVFRRDLMLLFPMLIFVVFGCFPFFLESSPQYYFIYNIVVGIALISILFYNIGFIRNSFRTNSNGLFLLLLCFLMIVESNFRSAWNFAHRCVFAISILNCVIALSSKDVKGTISNTLKYMLFIYVIFAVFTYLCSAISGFYENFMLPLYPEKRITLLKQWRLNGNPGLTNHYSTNGMILAAGFCISFSMLMTHRTWKSILITVFLYGALILTGKRAHFLFCTCVAVYIYYLSLRAKNIVNRWINFMLVVTILFSAVYIFISVRGANIGLYNRIVLYADSDDVSNGRFLLWANGIQIFLRNPVIGIGWKKYAYTVGASLHAGSLAYDTHNVYIQLLCETGIVGTMIFYTWFLTVYIASVKQLRKHISTSTKSDNEWLLCFSVMYQSFFLLYCITGNPLYEYTTFIPYFFSCAITFDYMVQDKKLSIQS